MTTTNPRQDVVKRVRAPTTTGLRFTLLLIAGVIVAGCNGEGGSTEPLPIAKSVELVSPVDTLIDLDATVQLQLTAMDDQGQILAVSGVDWRSSDPSVARVSSTGLVEPLSSGSVTITAEVDGVEGTIGLRIVQADLAGISASLQDPLLGSLIPRLSSTVSTSVEAAQNKAVDAVTRGNLAGLLAAVDEAIEAVAAVTDPDDRAMAGVIRLFLDHSVRLLNL